MLRRAEIGKNRESYRIDDYRCNRVTYSSFFLYVFSCSSLFTDEGRTQRMP